MLSEKMKLPLNLILLVISFSIILHACCQLTVKNLKLTGINCTSLNKKVIFKMCKVQPIRGGQQSYEIRYYDGLVPVKKLQVNLQFLKKTEGEYESILYNITVDVCKLFQMQNSARAFRFNAVAKMFVNAMDGRTSLNSCPIQNHNVIVSNVTTGHLAKGLKYIPFPAGEYGLATSWFSNNIPATYIVFFAHFDF